MKSVDHTRVLLLACLIGMVVPIQGEPGTAPPVDALKLAAKPVAAAVRLGDPVVLELTYSNVGKVPLSINMAKAVRCGSGWEGVSGGDTRSMVANGSAPRWRRIQPGEAFTIQVVNDEIAYKTLGKVKMTLRFYGSRQGQAPPDAYAGLRVSNSITFEVVDNALLRELRTEKPDLKVVRKEMLALLRRLDEKGHRIDKLFEEMEREHGALLVPPLLEIAADKAVDVTLRARAADHSGSAVYYARDKETPGLRKLALPVLKSLLFDPSVPVRVRAICGLCCADRTKPHLDRFRELLADPDETVRTQASGYLTRFMDHKETWPFVKEALMDSSLRARRIILGGRDLRFPTTRDHVELLLDCCRIANAEDTVKLLKGMKLSISNEDLADLSLLFDTKPEPVRIEILKLAKKTTGQKRIEIYKKALQAKSSQVRNAALAVMADSAGPSLAETLERFAASSAGSSETEKAKEILAALNAEVPFPDVKRLMAEILPPKATPPPAEKLVSQIESWEGRVAATKWLFIAEDPKDMDLFRSLLNAKRGVLRAIACRYLGRMKDQTSFRSIARLTQDPSALVRRIAARRLGELGRPEAIPCLLRLKNDPGDEVRSAVSRSLRKIPGSKATGELLELVKTEGKGMSWSIQENALDGLVERRDCGVVPALIELIDPPQSFSPTPSLPGALRKLTGHQITGDYDDPKDRTRLEKEWRQWWGKTAASRAPELPEPEASYLGCRLKLSSAKQIRTSQEVIVGLELRQGPDLAPLTVPVKDEGVEGHYQYVLFREGREVERGDFGDVTNWNRYITIPYGSIASISGMRSGTERFRPESEAGDYEAQVEARFLCTEHASKNFVSNTFAMGARTTAAEAFTLRSNRVPLKLFQAAEGPEEVLSPETLEKLAKILADPKASKRKMTVSVSIGAAGDDIEPQMRTIEVAGSHESVAVLLKQGRSALPSVLEYFSPEKATHSQISFLQGINDPRARSAIGDAFVAGRLNYWEMSSLPLDDPRVKERLVRMATAEVGGKSWSWYGSRRALEVLDGRFGPGDRPFVRGLTRELAARLISRRDRYTMRGGESIWGAFRTAFFLGRIGDKSASGVLRRAMKGGVPESYMGRQRAILLRWYAVAALKLIEIQSRPAQKRHAVITKWLRHCFSSREEHFMARGRLIPWLNELLGEKRNLFYKNLLPSLDDPWKIQDARRAMR